MCEYCNKPHGRFLTDGLFDQCRIEALQMFGTDKYKYTLCVNNSAWQEISFCPMCGRNLKEDNHDT